MNLSAEKRESILIIDDVTSNLATLAEIIRSAGYSARPVTSVDQATRSIEAKLPTIILLDVTMPEMSGYDYCRKLKKDARTRDIPVIFISGLNTAQDRIKGFECGAVDFISKPFEKTEVLMRMNTHIRLYNMQEQLLLDNKKLHALVNRQLFQIEEERRKMIAALAALSEDRDDSTGMHLPNISRNCRLIAMGLSLTHKYEKAITDEFIATIQVASKLHDIGKMGIPDKVLLKAGPLDDEEREIMMNHTVIGLNTLKDIYSDNTQNMFIKMAMDIAYCHHERWDGTGYPRGLSGTDIPLAARIMSVVDTYDAIVSSRCYKPAYSHESAMTFIKDHSGTNFDPDVVSIFCRLERRLARNRQESEVLDTAVAPAEDADSRR